MTALSTYWHHFLERWKGILAIFLAAVAIFITTLALSWKVGGDHSLNVVAVWPERVSASQSGVLQLHVTQRSNPAAGANVTLYRHKSGSHGDFGYAIAEDGLKDFVKITEGKANPDGSVTLDFPAAAPGVMPGKLLLVDNQATILVHIERDGEEVFLTRTIEGSQTGVMALSFDRPLYQPGQTVRMRAVLVDADTGEPRAGAKIKWKVRAPGGDLIFEEEAATSGSGVTHTEVALAPNGKQGAYTTSIEVGDRSLVSRTFEVRPFRLPRYKIDVANAQPFLQVDVPTELVVTATYTYGERVAGADVSLDVTATTRTGATAKQAFTGKTNANGQARFTYTPRDLLPGASVGLAARVSLAGRSEEGRGSTSVAGQGIGSVEIVRAGRATFQVNVPQIGYVIVEDTRGQPLAGVKVELALPEDKDERLIEVMTDEKGRATFSWSPRSNLYRVQARAKLASAPWRTFSLPVSVDYSSNIIGKVPSVVSVGAPFAVQLDGMVNPGALVLVRKGLPVASVNVPRSGGGQTVEITPPASARGLTTLVLMGQGNQRIDAISLWVKQRGGEKVSVTVPGEDHRPGMKATVDLAFPPTADGKPGVEAPVTFGLVGVDEALYAIKERAEAPLWSVLREEPVAMGSVLKMINAVDVGDEAAVDIASAKFQSTVQSLSSDNYGNQYPRDITREIERRKKAALQRSVAAFMLLLFLILGLYNAAHTWRSFSRQMFSWRRLGGMALVVVLGIILLTAVGAATRGDGLAGAMMLWLMLLGLLLLEASLKEPTTGLPRWFGVMFVMGATAMSAIVLEEAAYGRTPDWWEIFALVAAGPPIALVVLELLLWPFVLMHNEQRQAGLALITIAAAPIIGVFATSSSRHYEMAASKSAPEAIADRFVQVAVEEEMDIDGKPEPPSDSPSKPMAGKDAPRVRSYFPETMVWVPELASGKDGKASVDVELPDSITTWRLDAWAHTRDGRIGEGRAALRVWQPFFVELELPTNLTQGDIAQIPVSLVNRHDKQLEISLDASAEGALLMQGAPLGQLTLEPMERRVISVQVVAQRVGEGAVTFTAAINSEDGKARGDAVKRVVTVAPDGRIVRKSSSRLLNEAWTQEILVPGDALADTMLVDVEISPGPVADAIKGLASMLREPNGCFEQTSSANFPNVMILEALRKTKPAEWPGGARAHAEALAQATRMAQLGYQRILTFQKPEGAFALYPENYDPTIMLTAYGVLQLKKMSEVTSVDPDVIARAERWLVSQQNESGSWPMYAARLAGGDWRSSYEDVGQVRATSFVLLALARKPAPQHAAAREKAVAHILKHIDRVLAVDALALAANALLAVEKKQEAKRVLDNLAGRISRDSMGAHLGGAARTWMGSTDTYASVETTAIAARAMLELGVHGELLSEMLRYLVAAKSPYGGWGSTQATVWTLETFDALEPTSKGPVEISITLDGAAMAHANSRGEPGKVTVSPSSMLSTSFQREASPGAHLLGVTPSAASSASAQAITTYAVPWTSRNARVEDAPFIIEVDAPSSLTFGQAARVEVTVSNSSQQLRAASIVELPSMPAAAIDREAFDAMIERGEIDAYEVLPTHIRVYLSGFRADEKKTFAYDLTPMLRGEFSLTPASAWRFYTPTPRAFSDGGDVSVR